MGNNNIYSQKIFLNFILISITISLVSQNVNAAVNSARYDNYRVYRLQIQTDEHVRVLQELESRSDSYVFYGHARQPGQQLTIMVAAHKIPEIIDLMDRYGIKGSILDYNVQARIDAETKTVKPETSSADEMDWNHYFHLETINLWLDHLVERYDFISAVELGNSYEGVAIKGVKLSRKAGNTAVFVEGGIHAREWISPATVTFILNQLIVSADPAVIDLGLNFDWYFFPIVNPDGYKYTFEKDRLWRKSRKPYGINRGVDLNRNFDSNWNGIGSSPDPGSYDFCGDQVFSEPEARLIADFITQNKEKENIKTYIALHSYSQLLMFPFGHTPDPVDNYQDLKLICERAVQSLTAKHGTKFQSGSKHETIYPSSGGSIDWAYSEAKIPISLTFELRGPADSTDMFLLPADQITPTGEETLAAFVTIMNESRNLGYYN